MKTNSLLSRRPRLVQSSDPSEEFDTFADDLLGERMARTLIIVGASRIDILLLEILDTFLLAKRAKPSDSDELLEGDRPLATFSARIKLCYRIGIIDGTLCEALEALRGLRNPSAHHVTFDITKSPVREQFSKLRAHMVNRRSYVLTKQRYFGTGDLTVTEELQCALLTLCLLLESIRKATNRTAGSNSTLRISKK